MSPRGDFWPPFEERWAAAFVEGPGCWEWRGAIAAQGYGTISLNGKTASAHRVAWQRAYGPIPPGLYVCHRCDNRRCVRPDHLFLGTARANSEDMVRKGRSVKKEFCNRGHLLAQTRVVSGQTSYCRECNRINGRRRWLEKKVAA